MMSTTFLERLRQMRAGFRRCFATAHRHLYEHGWIRPNSLREAAQGLHRLVEKDKHWLLRKAYISPSHLRLDYLNTRKEIETSLKTRFRGSDENACERFFHLPAEFTLNSTRYCNPVDPWWQKKLDFVMQQVEKTRPRLILDLGAADCWFEEKWGELGIFTVAVEATTYHYMNGLMLKTARKLDFDILCGDVEDPWLWEVLAGYGDFDMCYLGDTIEHFETPAVVLERAAGLCESLLVITPLCEKTSPLPTRSAGDHKWLFDSRGLEAMIMRAGYATIDLREDDSMIWAFATK